MRLDEPAGAEKFRSIVTSFYRNADAIILMYSVKDQYTFEGLEYIASVAKDKLILDGDPVWALFGNKCDEQIEIEDLEEKVAVLSDRVTGSRELCDLHFSVSAKTGERAMEALDAVVKKVHRLKKSRAEEAQRRAYGMVIRDVQAERERVTCCS